MPFKNIITLRLTRYNIFIVTSYRPSSYTVAENEAMIAALQAFVLVNVTILIGDFNLPNIQWRDWRSIHIKKDRCREQGWQKAGINSVYAGQWQKVVFASFLPAKTGQTCFII